MSTLITRLGLTVLWGYVLTLASGAHALINPGPVVQSITQVGEQSLKGVRAITQDSSGFLWLATNQGLLRFDGTELKPFVAQNGLPHNDIRAMVADGQGHLWLATRGGGLSRFTVQTESFDNFSHLPFDPDSLDSNDLNSLSLDDKGQLWIGSRRGINRFDTQTLTNTRVKLTMPIEGPFNIHRMLADRSGLVWFSIPRQGLFVYSGQTGEVKHYDQDSAGQHGLDSDTISAIFEARDGQLWIGTAAAIHRLDRENDRFERFEIPLRANNKVNHASVTSLFEDSDGLLWISTFYNGVSRWDPESAKITNINRGVARRGSLNVLHINNIFQDSSGSIWLATPRDGLIQITRQAMAVAHFVATTEQAFSAGQIYPDHQGRIWLGMDNQLLVRQPQGDGFKLVASFGGPLLDILPIGDRHLAVLVKDVGIMKVALETLTLEPLFVEVNTGSVTAMAVADGHLWLAGGERLEQFDLQGDIVKTFEAPEVVEALWPVGEKIITRTPAGFSYMNAANGFWYSFQEVPGIQQIIEDGQSQLWIVAGDEGLYALDKKTGAMLGFERGQNGVPDKILSIANAADGKLWLNSESGLYLFDKALFKTSRISREKLLDNPLPGMMHQLPSGRLLLGTHQGVIEIQPRVEAAVAQDQQEAHAVLFTDFQLFGRSVVPNGEDPDAPLQRALNDTDSITLAHTNNWFTIAFAASDFQSADQSRYAYKMKGLSEQWIEVDGADPKAGFTSLAPGDYEFQVKVADLEGNWRMPIRTLQIKVTPPWWDSPLAWSVYVLGALILVFGVYAIRTRQLRHRAAALEQGIAERTEQLKQRADTIAQLLDEKEGLLADKDRLIANISHEFRTPLTLILGPLESELGAANSEQSRSLLTMAKANGRRLLAMVDQLLDIARLDDHKAMTLETRDVVETCRFLLASFAPMAGQRGIKLDADLPQETVLPVNMAPDALEKILSNLLSNAFKYSPDGGQVTVEAGIDGDSQVFVRVKDTGQGIAEADLETIFERFTRLKQGGDYVPGAGIGLALVKELIERHQGTIAVQSKLGQGSTFTVHLPLSGHEPGQSGAVNQLLLNEVSRNMEELSTQVTLQRPEPAADGARTSVLVIEDNPDMRGFILSCLSEVYVCLEAADGEQGVAQAKAELPDLIVCDVMMPKMDGFEVTATLKSDPDTSHIPIVLLTARGDTPTRLKGWREKADEFLEKPFNTEELLLRLANLLSVRQLLQAHYQRRLSLPDTEPVDGAPNTVAQPVNPAAQRFIDQLEEVLLHHYGDPAFDVSGFADAMALSHRQLGRKIKTLLDLTPAQVLRQYRLKKAAELLCSGLTPSVVIHQVGFTTHSYFSQCFKAQYGINPSDYAGQSGPVSE